MRKEISFVAAVLAIGAILPFSTNSEDLANTVKKAVEKATLNQPGTHPFHLKATYAPSFERDKGTNRNGTIEFWWQSPTQWRREVTSPDFHQVEIVDGDRRWQHNDGDYFPEWLRELAIAIVQPVVIPISELEARVTSGDVKHFRFPVKGSNPPEFVDQVSIGWSPTDQFPDEEANSSGALYLLDGKLSYAGGAGWSRTADHDFKGFHGLSVATTVDSGAPQVTAKVVTLEDLPTQPAGFFDANAPGGDPQPIETVVLGEAQLRKSLISGGNSFVWPAITDGPFEGTVWMKVVLDRTGKIRDIYGRVSENPKMTDAAEQGFRAMQFQPVVQNGRPVQAVGTLSVHFSASRPAGSENFDTARNYFENARKLDFLAAAAKGPYKLTAEFQAGTPTGIQNGKYEDTWLSEDQWKREAWLGSSHVARSQDGEKYYRISEGPDAALVGYVILCMEPLPAADTMSEGDWRIRRDVLGGMSLVRIVSGIETPNGELDPKNSRGYWFDQERHLIKSFLQGYEVRPAKIEAFDGVGVPREIDIVKDGELAMRITVMQIARPDADAAKSLALKDHEWKRMFTAEAR